MQGRLIYLMGPSGSGKDSLLHAARAPLEAHGCRFARRVITRSAESVGEDALGVTPDEFERLQGEGAFALSWHANGLAYGIPREIDDWLSAGQDVLINGSKSPASAIRSCWRFFCRSTRRCCASACWPVVGRRRSRSNSAWLAAAALLLWEALQRRLLRRSTFAF